MQQRQDNGPRALYALARELEGKAHTYGVDLHWPEGWRDAMAALGRARALIAREVLRSQIELEQRLARLGAKLGPALAWARTQPGGDLTPQELADRIVQFERATGEQITTDELADLGELTRALLAPELAAEVAALEQTTNGGTSSHDARTADHTDRTGAPRGNRDPELERQRQLELAAVVDAARARADARRR